MGVLCCCLHVNYIVYKHFDRSLHVRSSDATYVQNFRPVYSGTSENGPSLERTLPLERTVALPPFESPIILIHLNPLGADASELPRADTYAIPCVYIIAVHFCLPRRTSGRAPCCHTHTTPLAVTVASIVWQSTGLACCFRPYS